MSKWPASSSMPGMIEYIPNSGRRPRSVECNGGTRPDVAGCFCLLLPPNRSEWVMCKRVLVEGGRSEVDAFSERAERILLNCEDLTMGTAVFKHSVSSSVVMAPPVRGVQRVKDTHRALVRCVRSHIR